MNRLNAPALGLAAGILLAVSAFVLVLLSSYFDYATPFVELLKSLYLGVDNTFVGALIAMPWAFVDGFLGGFLLAWLYNRFTD